jgi:hypothetical protein
VCFALLCKYPFISCRHLNGDIASLKPQSKPQAQSKGNILSPGIIAPFIRKFTFKCIQCHENVPDRLQQSNFVQESSYSSQINRAYEFIDLCSNCSLSVSSSNTNLLDADDGDDIPIRAIKQQRVENMQETNRYIHYITQDLITYIEVIDLIIELIQFTIQFSHFLAECSLLR